MRNSLVALTACGISMLVACETTSKENQMNPTTDQAFTKPMTDTAKAAPDAIRSFRIAIPDDAIAGMRRRLADTRWPDKETVTDRSQGEQLATLQELVRYWATDYDWRKVETKLNSLPQFITKIDGVDIQFIHVRSKQANALPLLIVHGWPGSVIEQLKLIEPLTNPTAHGGRAEDAYDVVIPSLPGFGFSGKPTEPGWDTDRTGRAFATLMKRLGYSRYVAQGGDWGAGVVEAMARQHVGGLIAIHSNLPAVVPPEIDAVFGGAPPPANLSDDEKVSLGGLAKFGTSGARMYVEMMTARPQAVGYGITDSPAGLAGWMLQHSGFDAWSFGKDPSQSPTRDDVLDNFSLYWLTNSGTSSARFYWDNKAPLISSTAQRTADITIPVAVTAFPQEVFLVPESWARRAFKKLVYFNKAKRGGHFAAWEYPEDFAQELRAAFRTVR
jgi:pimeloyl-ACP methyl ester carboxylesterase